MFAGSLKVVVFVTESDRGALRQIRDTVGLKSMDEGDGNTEDDAQYKQKICIFEWLHYRHKLTLFIDKCHMKEGSKSLLLRLFYPLYPLGAIKFSFSA
jgi:hypothetical protein